MKTQSTQSTHTKSSRRQATRRQRRIRQAWRQTSVAEKDWFKSIWIWVLLEGLCFGLAPHLQLIEPGDRWQQWFVISIPAGIIGAILIGFSSQGIEQMNNQRNSPSKQPLLLLGQLMGGVGLAAVLFPLVMLLLEFVSKATTEIIERGG